MGWTEAGMPTALKRRVSPATDEERSRFYGPVARIFRRLYAEEGKLVRDSYRSAGTFEAAREAVLSGRLARALGMLYGRATDFFARWTLSDLGAEEAAFDPGPLRRWSEDTARERASYLNGTSIEAVRRLVERGEERGASQEETARDIEDYYRRRAPARSAALAITEVSAAANRAAVEAARQSGGAARKRWNSRDDDRVRPTHAAADGQTVGLDEDFIVGGFSGGHPCDPRLPGRETINCRCEMQLLS